MSHGIGVNKELIMSRLNIFKPKASDGFLEALINDIEMNANRGSNKPVTAFKPSMMHCQREVFFAFKNYQQDTASVDYQSVGILESGTDRHRRIQDALLKSKKIEYLDISKYILENQLGYLEVIGNFGNETLLYHKQLNIRFMTDGLVKYNGKVYILEIKTEAGMKFERHSEVWEEHYLQASCYSIVFMVNDIIFLYENRDTLEKKVCELHVTHEMRQGVYDFINSVNSYLEAGALPPKTTNSKHCQWCAYRSTCKGV